MDKKRGCYGCAHADWDADGCTCRLDGLKVLNASKGCKYRKEKAVTNGDKIRAMTDEELAEMVSMKVCRIVKPDGSDCPKGFYFGKCDKCVLKWLKQEVDPNDER